MDTNVWAAGFDTQDRSCPLPITVDIVPRQPPRIEVVGQRIPEHVRTACVVTATEVLRALGIALPRAVVRVSIGRGHDYPLLGPVLPVVIALIRALAFDDYGEVIFAHGDVSLSGGIRPARGALAAYYAHSAAGAFVTAAHAALPASADVWIPDTLDQFVAELRGDVARTTGATRPTRPSAPAAKLDLADLPGTFDPIIEALLPAVASRTPILLVGDPGVGKTMLAQRLAGLYRLPSYEATLVQIRHDLAGLTRLENDAPFRAPHYTVSEQGMLGTGPVHVGELALARSGVLFLDEVDLFRPSVLRSLLTDMREMDDRPLLVAATTPGVGSGTLEPSVRAAFPVVVRLPPLSRADIAQKSQWTTAAAAAAVHAMWASSIL